MAEAAGVPIRVLVVDDHPLFRDGLVSRIDRQGDMLVCGEAGDLTEALETFSRMRPDVVVVDISLQTGNGLDLIKQMRLVDPSVRVLVLSMYSEATYAERAMRAGAMGYLTKGESGRKVIEALRTIHSGQLYFSDSVTQQTMRRVMTNHPKRSLMDTLSDRELEIYQLIGQGLDTHEVAQQLLLSEKTVRTYRDRIRVKLQLKSSNELTRHAISWYLQENH